MKFKILALTSLLTGCAPLSPEQISDMQYFGNALNQAAMENNYRNQQLELERYQLATQRMQAAQQPLVGGTSNPFYPATKVMIVPAPQPGVIQSTPSF